MAHTVPMKDLNLKLSDLGFRRENIAKRGLQKGGLKIAGNGF